MPLPGRRARYLAVKAAYGGGTAGGLIGVTFALLATEAKLARRVIGTPTDSAPTPARSYGRGRRGQQPLRMAVLGDSAAAGLGCEVAAQTPGALLAGGVARDLSRRVELRVLAVTGARSAELHHQVRRALDRPVDVAVIIIGANDVTHRVPNTAAASDLGRAVQALHDAGALVVVGTCPDLGTVKPVLQPLRTVAAHWSRRLAAAQTVAVVGAGGVAVSLGDLLARDFSEQPHLWSADRFHPSPQGYRRIVDVLLPSVLEGTGVTVPVSVPVSDSVTDVDSAADLAAHEPGVTVEATQSADPGPGDQPAVAGESAARPVGTALPGGRLVRLRRRLPLPGRGAPEGPTDVGELARELAPG